MLNKLVSRRAFSSATFIQNGQSNFHSMQQAVKVQPKQEITEQEFNKFGTFKASEMEYTERNMKLDKPQGALQFGRVYTDHMLSIDWSRANGWEKPQIIPYGPIKLAVTATSLHYGISCYEGMNVVQNQKTNIPQAFRPMLHLDQFRASTHHIDMPLFDNNELLDCMKQLVNIDSKWFPDHLEDPGQLYMRIAHISTDQTMGVKTPSATKIFAMLNPTTLKHKNLSVKCSDGVNKNWPLGHGQYTLSGNLGPLVPSVSEAKRNGFDDVLWLLDDYVQEMTILNTMFVLKDRYGKLKLVTPPDNGCILRGVTTQSILQLSDQISEESGMEIEERPISIHEIISAHQEDRLVEAIGCSTSSHIQPINRIVYRENNIQLDTNKDSQYVSYLNNLITNIMIGSEDHQWVSSLEI